MTAGFRFATTAALVAAGAALLALVAAPAGVWLGAWDFRQGFQLLRWAVMLGLAGVALGLLVTLVGALRRQRRARDLALLTVVLAVPAVALPLSQYRRARSLPPINDVTTDPGDPPSFRVAGRGDSNGAAGVPYPAETFAELQRSAYPDLVTLTFAESPARVHRAGVAVAREMPGWRVVAADSSAGDLEATATTRWFRFVDDVVVRVRPRRNGRGSEVDVRSRSRVGVSDVGANAARIREFRRRLTAELSAEAA